MSNMVCVACGRTVVCLGVGREQTTHCSTAARQLHNSVDKTGGLSRVFPGFVGSFSAGFCPSLNLFFGSLSALSTTPIKTTTKFYKYISLSLLGASL